MEKKKVSKQYISIPYEITKDTRLTDKQKMIYGIIEGFDAQDQVCYIKNPAIAEILCTTTRTVSEGIRRLNQLGLIMIFNPDGRSRSLTTRVKRRDVPLTSVKSASMQPRDVPPGPLKPASSNNLSITNKNNLNNKNTCDCGWRDEVYYTCQQHKSQIESTF